MSGSNRTLTWYEAPYDAGKIRDNGWNLQLAQQVASGTTAATSNLIWQSQAMAPTTMVSWKVEYGLNWTATLPPNGVQVQIGGVWQACNKGDSYDINAQGFWDKSTSAGTPGWLGVGSVNYKYPNVAGIHIVVGVKNALTGQFDPVFVDSTELPMGSSGIYQPQESMSWWLQAGNRTGQVYHDTHSTTTSKDFSSPSPVTGQFNWWTSFLFDAGKWTISDTPPPQRFMSPPPSEHIPHNAPLQLVFGPSRWKALFTPFVAAATRAAVIHYVVNKLAEEYNGVEMTFTKDDGSELEIKVTSKKIPDPGALADFALNGLPEEPVERALMSARTARVLPAEQKWTVQNLSVPQFSINGQPDLTPAVEPAAAVTPAVAVAA